VLSRFGPLGLSVLALVASFVIVLTAGGVLATSRNQPPPLTPTKTPQRTTFALNLAALPPDGGDVEVTDGVRVSLRTSAPPPLATAPPTAGPSTPGGGQSAALLCLTLSDRWSLPSGSRAWTKDGRTYCRSVYPQRSSEINVVLERTR
jgi:hypothetical protein